MKKRITFRLDVTLYKVFLKKLIDYDLTMQDFFTSVVYDFLDDDDFLN